MSDWCLWQSADKRVTATWDKNAPHWRVYLHEFERNGLRYGRTLSYRGEAQAIRAAKRWARKLRNSEGSA